MRQPKHLSRQELIRQRQRSSFVGRVEQLEVFKHNLTNLHKELDGFAYPEAFLFNIWGQGGVGKSSLLRQFEGMARRQGHLVTRIDEGIAAVPEAMATFAKQLADQGQSLTKFGERYRVYQQKREELETDPDAPQGFSAFVGKTAAKVGLKLGRKIPMGDVALDFIDEESAIEGAGEWATYVTRKLKNKDEIQLVNEPVEVLTPLFLEDLSNITIQQIVLQFDTYERIGEILDDWLLDILKERYGVLPSNCIWVIAGREQLSANSWSGYEPVQFPLEPFSTEEATHFLQRHGVANTEVIEIILDVSGRLPLLLAILAESSPNEPTQVGEASGTAVERFLQWVDDPVKRQLAMDAALPQSLNRDVVTQLVGDENDIDTLFIWLKGMPFVRERSDGWAYHDVVRPQMLRYQKRESRSRWTKKHQLLAKYYQGCGEKLKLDEKIRYRDKTWQDYALKYLYHELCSNPQEQLPVALNNFLDALKQNRSFALWWGEVILAVGEDLENQIIKQWGEKLTRGLKAYEENDYLVTIKTFTLLLNSSQIDQIKESIIFAWRGEVHRLINQYENALKDFNRAIELNPSYKWAMVNRGRTYRLMKRYDEALEDFNRAIELDLEYDRAIANRGRTYRLMKRYDEALEDFNRAIELDPNYDWAIANRAITYQVIENHDKALKDLNDALELAPDNKWYLQQRAWLQQTPSKYEQSIEDFDYLIKLAPENISYIAGRGLVLLLHGSYERALEDWNHVIELHESSSAYCYRALTYLYLRRIEQARQDISQAIKLAQDQYNKDPDKHYNTCNLGLYCLIVRRLNDAKFFYQETLKRGISNSTLKEAIEDLNRLWSILPNHPHILEMREFLKAQFNQRQNQVHMGIFQIHMDMLQDDMDIFQNDIHIFEDSDEVDEYY